MQTIHGRAEDKPSATSTFTVTIVSSTSFAAPHGPPGGSAGFSKGLIVVFAFLILLMAVGGYFLFQSGGVTKDDEQWDEQISAAKRRWHRLVERLSNKPKQCPTVTESAEENEHGQLGTVGSVASQHSEDDLPENEPNDDSDNDSARSTNERENADDSMSEKQDERFQRNRNSTPLPPSSSHRSGRKTKSPTPPPRTSTHPQASQGGYYYFPVAPSHSIHNGYSYPLNFYYGWPSQTDSFASSSQHQYHYDRREPETGTYGGYANGYPNNYASYGSTGAYGYYQPNYIPPLYYPYQRAYI
ncbi:hypothetical protein POJ06DRAFT_241512 [Lipomyces tetrasporus]|uniref:Uncharacterized protein n=1 Tax=Lipomyces tetrasporus TaxID=54092 RepID=A0AAD7QKQ8_9ASCO|nr:uncharacterized protein POJ06DRAFT_241512 [Lipomyces tetrasporus]KAJ8096884.1 hypothetical protein POJ06DRAFT_241512 [Lipomyces tetrasporus]